MNNLTISTRLKILLVTIGVGIGLAVGIAYLIPTWHWLTFFGGWCVGALGTSIIVLVIDYFKYKKIEW